MQNDTFEAFYGPVHMWFTAVTLGVITVCTIIGNVFVLAAILLERNLQRVSNYLIFSLAVADLMVAALVMPVSIVKEVSKNWWLGVALCDVWIVMDVTCCTASILHLVAIAVDRYWAVTRVNYIRSRNTRSIVSMIVVVWIVSLVISLPTRFHLNRNAAAANSTECNINDDKAFTIFSTVVAFYLPMCFLMGVYLKIYQTAHLRIHKKQFRPNSTSVMPSSINIAICTNEVTNITKPITVSDDRSTGCLTFLRDSRSSRTTAEHNNDDTFCPECESNKVRQDAYNTSSCFSEPYGSQSSSTQSCQAPCCRHSLTTDKETSTHDASYHTLESHQTNCQCMQTTDKIDYLAYNPSIDQVLDSKQSAYGVSSNLPTSCGKENSQTSSNYIITQMDGSITVCGNSIESSQKSLPLSTTTHSCLSQLTYHKVESVSTDATDKASSYNSPNSSIYHKVLDDTGPQNGDLKTEAILTSPYISESEQSSICGIQRCRLEESTEDYTNDIHGVLLNTKVGRVLFPDSPFLISSGSNFSETPNYSPIDRERTNLVNATPKQICFLTPSCPNPLLNSFKSDKGSYDTSIENENEQVKICPCTKQKLPVGKKSTDQDGIHDDGHSSPIHHTRKVINCFTQETLTNLTYPDCQQAEEKSARFDVETVIRECSHSITGERKDSLKHTDAKSTNSILTVAEHNRERLENRRERKAVTTLAIITGCFILCWLPFFVRALIAPLCGATCEFPRIAESVFLWLGYLNSLLNPILYTVFAPDFRNAFKKIINGRFLYR